MHGPSTAFESASSAALHGLPRQSTIARRLAALVLIVASPLVVLGLILGFLYADAERRVIEAERADVTRDTADILDRHISVTIAGLRVLAASPDLQAGRLEAFRAYAAQVTTLKSEAITLWDRDGKQLLSTNVSYGQLLPTRTDLTPIAPVFAGKSVEVSDLLGGTVPQRSPMFLVTVPVYREGTVVYALSSSLLPSALESIFAEAGLKEDWLSGIVDRTGTIVARSRETDRFVGQLGRPEVLTAAKGGERSGIFPNVTLEGWSVENSFFRSALTGWTVVVAVPTHILRAPFYKVLGVISLLAVALIAVSIILALMTGIKIAGPVSALADAVALVEGTHTLHPNYKVEELNQVARAFDQTTTVVRELKAAQAELQQTSTLLDTVINCSTDLIYAKDTEGRALMFNVSTLDTIGKGWTELRGRNEAEWHKNTAEAAAILANDRQVIESGKTLQVEEIFSGPHGRRVYLSTKSPLVDAGGKIIGLVGVSTDITDKKAQEEKIGLLMRELAHRTKNLLSVVHAIANQLARRTSNLQDFQARFSAHLTALAKLQDLLISKEGIGAPLETLIATQLEAFMPNPQNVRTSGPPILLSPTAAQAIALALHELATNSLKYGSLSVPTGKVSIEWQMIEAPDDKRFRMEWRESDGPPVQPPMRRGFGSIVLKRMCTQIGATAKLDFPVKGVCWTIETQAKNIEADVAKQPET